MAEIGLFETMYTARSIRRIKTDPVPDEIITKPGPLSEEEWEFMKQHTVMGEQIIAAAGPSRRRHAVDPSAASRVRQVRVSGSQPGIKFSTRIAEVQR